MHPLLFGSTEESTFKKAGSTGKMLEAPAERKGK